MFRFVTHRSALTSRPSPTSKSSSSSSDTLAVTSRMIFFKVAFNVDASEDRSLTNLLGVERWRVSDICSKRRSCEAMLGPVMTNAEGT